MIIGFLLIFFLTTSLIRASNLEPSESSDPSYNCIVYASTAPHNFEIYLETGCDNPGHEDCLSRWISNNPNFAFNPLTITTRPYNRNESKFFKAIKDERDPRNLIQFLRYAVTRKFSFDYYQFLIHEIRLKKLSWNINEKFSNGRSLLTLADDNLPAIKALISNGADMNSISDEIYGKLIISAFDTGNCNFSDFLFRKGENRNYYEALIFAIENDRLDLVKLFISNDANVVVNGDDLMRKAVNPDIIKYLLGTGKIKLTFDSARNLLIDVINLGNSELIKSLISYISEKHDILDVMTSKSGSTAAPIDLLIKDPKSFKFFIGIAKRIQPDWNLNKKLKRGKILLELALNENNMEIVEYLKVSGVSKSIFYEIQYDKVMKSICKRSMK